MIDIIEDLESARSLMPDTKDGRYRSKLIGWARKLEFLLREGWELDEIKRLSVGRFKTVNPKQWPSERIMWRKTL